jgi:hypothetical protein
VKIGYDGFLAFVINANFNTTWLGVYLSNCAKNIAKET